MDDRGRDGGTNFILRIKEQETRLTLQEDDDDDDFFQNLKLGNGSYVRTNAMFLTPNVGNMTQRFQGNLWRHNL